ncbi:MAG: 2-oxoisovalerate dehydrogenase [Ignavibacteriae bacterium HGW-Ignavibacteriae-1]|jgi:predicted RNase H-like HicB family nuclease|nr:MAG: 2-oxoisovalerate dehydrogenase [Ignavibacteriae bacterium HGW-Ignavibacteriae-1]
MDEIIFKVDEELEGGYSASALGFSIVTQGDTMEELKSNIIDAIKCHFEVDIPKVVRLHFVHHELFKVS